MTIEQIEQQLAATTDDAERIRLLNELAGRINRDDPQRALQLAGEARCLAVGNGDRRAEAISLRWIASCHESLSDYTTAMEFARRSYAIFQELGDLSGVANASITIGIIARGLTDHGMALSAFNEALAIFSEQGDQLRLAAAYNNIGTVYSTISAFPEALEAYLASLRIYQENGEELNAAIIAGNIGIVYYYMHDNDTAYGYHYRGFEVFRRLNVPYSMALALGNLSSIDKARGNYDAALQALDQALEIFQKIGEKRYEATTRVKIGMLNDLLGDPKGGLEQMRLAAKIAGGIGDRETYCDTQQRIGEIHRLHGRYRQAIAALNRSLVIAEELKIVKTQAELHESLALAHEAAGDIGESLPHLKRSAELQRSLFGQERQRAIAEMQTRFDVERAEREREMFRLKSEHLEEMMEQRSKELTAMAMHLVQKNSFLQKLRNDALQLAKNDPASKPALGELLRAMNEEQRGEDDWGQFEEKFKLVHPGFIQLLSQRYPKLSPAELKVCAMLKINLSNKEIMKLLSVSLRNVESHRYSIRKKLGLPSDTNLSVFLAGL
jgi:tetratricopeptide (TPR) repeat protein/DNA-binding CsgD family transcriptional regulator